MKKKKHIEQRLFSITEASQLLGLSQVTIRRLINEKHLEALYLPNTRTRYIDIEDIDYFIHFRKYQGDKATLFDKYPDLQEQVEVIYKEALKREGYALKSKIENPENKHLEHVLNYIKETKENQDNEENQESTDKDEQE